MLYVNLSVEYWTAQFHWKHSLSLWILTSNSYNNTHWSNTKWCFNQQTHPRASHFFCWRAFWSTPPSHLPPVFCLSFAVFCPCFSSFCPGFCSFFASSVNSFWSHCRKFLVALSIMGNTFFWHKKFLSKRCIRSHQKQTGRLSIWCSKRCHFLPIILLLIFACLWYDLMFVSRIDSVEW